MANTASQIVQKIKQSRQDNNSSIRQIDQILKQKMRTK